MYVVICGSKCIKRVFVFVHLIINHFLTQNDLNKRKIQVYAGLFSLMHVIIIEIINLHTLTLHSQ